MIVAHLADLHLGFRAYHRLAPGDDGGSPRFNARERDVSLAFRAALDRLIELKADLVIIAGDVFHTVRPSNAAIADAFRQFARFQAARPTTPMLIIAGNHDSPRAVETGSILALLNEIPNVTVVDREARVVEYPELDAAVLCLPHNALAGGALGRLEAPEADTKLLAMHATVRGEEVDRLLGYASEFGGAQIDIGDIRVERWDYVALGHYHIATQLAPNMWYAGAIERTSTNVWMETGAKGFVTWDTRKRQGAFHPVPSRPMVDLPRFSARAPDGTHFLEGADIDARIQERVDAVPGGIDGKIVRLIIHDVPRDLFRDLDHRRLREYRARALHFHLDVRRPPRRSLASRATLHVARSIEEEARTFITEVWEPTAPDVDRGQLADLALRYLASAGLGPDQPLIDVLESGD